MKRSAFDERRDQATADETNDDRLPCRWCQKPTLRETLGQYGGRCFSCYEAYCQAPTPQPNPRVADRARPKIGKLDLALPQQVEVDREAAKAETARRVAQYARERGIA